MKNTCQKCQTDCKEKGTYRIEGGNKYYFCKICSIILDENPNLSIFIFLQPIGHELIQNKKDLNILNARIKRQKKLVLL